MMEETREIRMTIVPGPPETLEETGLSLAFLVELACKTLYFGGVSSLSSIAELLVLPISVSNDVPDRRPRPPAGLSLRSAQPLDRPPREGARLPDAQEREEVRDPLRPDHPLIDEHRAEPAGRRGVPPQDRDKIKIDYLREEEYVRISRQVCERLGLPFRPEVIRYLMEVEHIRRGRLLSACHPNDVLSRVVEICQYEGTPLRLDNELVARACRDYFMEM